MRTLFAFCEQPCHTTTGDGADMPLGQIVVSMQMLILDKDNQFVPLVAKVDEAGRARINQRPNTTLAR